MGSRKKVTGAVSRGDVFVEGIGGSNSNESRSGIYADLFDRVCDDFQIVGIGLFNVSRDVSHESPRIVSPPGTTSVLSPTGDSTQLVIWLS